MAYEVVVVGAGVGGLTTAALLAARGVEVCVLERSSQAGGCLAPVEIESFVFERGGGLYAGWAINEIHDRVFSELSVKRPEVSAAEPSYVVRLPDGVDVVVTPDSDRFESELRRSFPECSVAAVKFYDEILRVADLLERAGRRAPALASLSTVERMKLAAREPRAAARVLAGLGQSAARHLSGTSSRFRRFIDAQLHTFTQTTSDRCAWLYAAVALAQPIRGMATMPGGGRALIDALVESIEKSGGTIRLNSPVLRLVFRNAGRPTGVDLLSGETINATRAIVSNLTVADTYGKLVGATRIPVKARARLQKMRGWGAYQMFMSMEESARARLGADHLILLSDWQTNTDFDPETCLMMLNATRDESRAPAGQVSATLSTWTRAEKWFTFHEDETAHDEEDTRTLEDRWDRLHASLPELGSGIEIIETSTPRTFYEEMRRKLGMIGTPLTEDEVAGSDWYTHQSEIPNLLMTGDTVFPGTGVAAVTHSALIVANEIASPRS